MSNGDNSQSDDRRERTDTDMHGSDDSGDPPAPPEGEQGVEDEQIEGISEPDDQSDEELDRVQEDWEQDYQERNEPERSGDPDDDEISDSGSGIPTWLGVLVALLAALTVFVLVAWGFWSSSTTDSGDKDKQKTAQKKVADPDEQSEETREGGFDDQPETEQESDEDPLEERVKVRLKKEGVWEHAKDFKGLIGSSPALALEHCADVNRPGDCGDLVEIAYRFENKYVVSNRIEDIRKRHQKDNNDS